METWYEKRGERRQVALCMETTQHKIDDDGKGVEIAQYIKNFRIVLFIRSVSLSLTLSEKICFRCLLSILHRKNHFAHHLSAPAIVLSMDKMIWRERQTNPSVPYILKPNSR